MGLRLGRSGHLPGNAGVNMEFINLLIHLNRSRGGKLSYASSRMAHAMVLDRIGQEDPQLGKNLHNAKRGKGISIALIPIENADFNLRISLMGSFAVATAEQLANSFSKKPQFRLGNVLCESAGIHINLQPGFGLATWDDLMSQTPTTNILFRFLTPTAIRKVTSFETEYSSLLLSPQNIFTSMQSRWRSLGGPKLDVDIADLITGGGCVISKFSLSSVEISLGSYTMLGSIGYVVYHCLNHNLTFMKSLARLARLAPFSGVGYHTAQGMGAVETYFSEE